MPQSRRNFIQKSALAFAGTASFPFIGKAAAFHTKNKTEYSLPIGIAGYTFAKFDMDQAIAMMKRLDIRYLSIKDIHLPINSSEDKIKEVLANQMIEGTSINAAGFEQISTLSVSDDGELVEDDDLPAVNSVEDTSAIDEAASADETNIETSESGRVERDNINSSSDEEENDDKKSSMDDEATSSNEPQ